MEGLIENSVLLSAEDVPKVSIKLEPNEGKNENSTVTNTTSIECNNLSKTESCVDDESPSSKDAADSSSSSCSKKHKKKLRHCKKTYIAPKEASDRGLKRMQSVRGRKRTQSFPTLSKFFLPNKRPRKDAFIPPTKFLLGGNISDPLNLNSLQDEDINRAMNAVTPKSSPLPTPPRHKAKIDVIIPLNIRDPLNLMDPLDNEEYEKRLQMQQRRPKKRKVKRRLTETEPQVKVEEAKKEEKPVLTLPLQSIRKRSCSDSDKGGKDCKKLRRMDSMDKIVSPVVPQPGAWMRARPQSRAGAVQRAASPQRPSTSVQDTNKLPKFQPKNIKYQYGNYDRYYGYRNLNASMDVRLQVFEMHKHLFQNKDVLDIGCNVGHISIAVAKNLGAKSVVGIDIDPVLIGRAKRNLRSFIPIPTEVPKPETLVERPNEKNVEPEVPNTCDNETKGTEDKKQKKLKKPKKNRKSINKPELGQCYFPISMAMMYGPLQEPVLAQQITQQIFPYNVTFKQGNYVPREDMSVGSGAESPQFDLILCLSTTKWLHLNWGDMGIKRAFKKMFNDLRPGGKLVLEAQNWASYRKKKRLTPTIYENFNSIEMFPKKFRDYLLSAEVGFSKCCVLGVPQHASKGFRRPIQLYVKGDFTPSKARWSDAYAPSSHHRPEAEPPRRTVYAPVGPAYRPSDDAPSCGAATPYSPNLECCADDSPFYNPRSDSYAPSYEPPRPTVYASIGSPVGSASPASPAASPASPAPHASPGPYASPAPHASPLPEARSARVYLSPNPPNRQLED